MPKAEIDRTIRHLVLILAMSILLGLTKTTATAQSVPPLPSKPSLTAAERVEVVRSAAGQIEQNYVFENKAKQIAAQLRGSVAQAAANAPEDPKAFAEWLTGELRRIGSDKRLELTAPSTSSSPIASQTRAQRLGWLDRLRRRNYDFIRVERLAGNVGYLSLNSFPPPEVAQETAAAAMAFLKHSDALIIDLRANGGGTGDMVRLLASYFFAEPTRLSRSFRRYGVPQVSYDSTLTTIPGERMPIIDLFILTSGETFSAAEAFAFALQQRNRAQTVGEKTGGGGNAGDYLDVAYGFSVFVPDVAVSSPISDESWEGVGVKPNIPVTSIQALEVAHRTAVRRLLVAATDPTTRQRYQQVLEEIASSPAN